MTLQPGVFQGGQHQARGVAQQRNQRFSSGIRTQSEGIPDLRLSALFRKVLVDLPEHFVKEQAVLMRADPLLEPFERGMIGAAREERIADEPFDHQVEANLKFELAQRPAEECADEQGAHQVGYRVCGTCAGTCGVMEGSTGAFERREVQGRVQVEQKVIARALQQFRIDLGADPVENGVQIRHEQNAHKVG